MKDFLADVVAVMLGVMLLAIGYAYCTADPTTSAYCDVITSNPIDQTECTIQLTLNP